MPCASAPNAPWVDGVAVTAHDGHAGQSSAAFGANHMHDALAFGQERKVGRSAVFFDVGVQRGNLLFADQVGNAVVAQLPAGRRCVVVCGSDDGAGAPNFATRHADAFKGLRAGNFVD